MPQSTAFLSLKAEALRVLQAHPASNLIIRPEKLPRFGADRPILAKVPQPCKHGTCLALRVQGQGLEVLIRETAGSAETWAALPRILSPDERRAWARKGFG